MMRVLCAWFPAWAIQRLRQTNAGLKQEPVVIYETDSRRTQRVVAASAEARTLGVTLGMRAAEASGLQHVTDEHLHEHDPWVDRRELKQLAFWGEQFSPKVGLLGTDALAFDVTGVSKLFGGETTHVEAVRKAFAQRGLECRLALADTVGAAWGLARFHAQEVTIVAPKQQALAMEALPVQALRLEEHVVADLRSLGLKRIGQVVELPREELTARFGEQLIVRLDQALSSRAEAVTPCRPAPVAAASWATESPVNRWELLEVVLGRLLQRVIRQLPLNTGIVRLRCQLGYEKRAPYTFIVGLVRPTSQRQRMLELIRLQWEGLQLAAPVASLRIEVMQTGIKVTRQNELFASSTRDDPRALADLVERLAARLGREQVVRPRLVREAQPEQAVQYEPLLEGKKTIRRKASSRKTSSQAPQLWQRPIHVERRPVPLQVTAVIPLGPPARFRLRGEDYRIERTWGPERIETSWWRGRMVRRDYYRVETQDGQWFWLYRRLQDGKWFLHGRFA